MILIKASTAQSEYCTGSWERTKFKRKLGHTLFVKHYLQTVKIYDLEYISFLLLLFLTKYQLFTLISYDLENISVFYYFL